MTQEQFNKADLLDRKIAKIREIINGSFSPGSFIINQPVFLNYMKEDKILQDKISSLIDEHVKKVLTECYREFEAL